MVWRTRRITRGSAEAAGVRLGCNPFIELPGAARRANDPACLSLEGEDSPGARRSNQLGEPKDDIFLLAGEVLVFLGIVPQIE
jgi:hypothetical protein